MHKRSRCYSPIDSYKSTHIRAGDSQKVKQHVLAIDDEGSVKLPDELWTMLRDSAMGGSWIGVLRNKYEMKDPVLMLFEVHVGADPKGQSVHVDWDEELALQHRACLYNVIIPLNHAYGTQNGGGTRVYPHDTENTNDAETISTLSENDWAIFPRPHEASSDGSFG